jgi:hypothetical protein
MSEFHNLHLVHVKDVWAACKVYAVTGFLRRPSLRARPTIDLAGYRSY